MPVNLSRVNISIAEFQAISSGEINAGEVKLKNDHSLEKVNHHAGALRGFNTTPLSHAEIFAVKSAFVRALGAGGVQQDELNRIRAELGLGAGNGANMQSLRERSIKPLTRQQVREILDRCADTLNAHDGAGTIRTEAQMTEKLSDRERETRTASREAANNALAGNRAAAENEDITLFTRLVAGDFAGITHADSLRMIKMAQAKIDAARAKHPGAKLPTNDAKTLSVQWELSSGQKIDFTVRMSTAAFVGKMEDAIFTLTNSTKDAGGKLTGIVTPEGRNKAIRDALAYPTQKEILPHDIRVIVDEMLAGARQKFGTDIIPFGARFCEVITGSHDTWELINGLGTQNPIGADSIRSCLEELLIDTCVQRAAGRAIDAEAGRQGVTIRSGLGRRFLLREPQVAADLRAAADPAAVAAAFDAARGKMKSFVEFAASVVRHTETGFFEAAADELSDGIGGGIPRSALLAQIRRWSDVNAPVEELGAKILSGEIEAAGPGDVERLFREKARHIVNKRVEIFTTIDEHCAGLSRQISDRLKADVLRFLSISKKTFDIGKLVAVARGKAFADALAKLGATLTRQNLTKEDGYAALEEFHATSLELMEAELGNHLYGVDDRIQALQTVLRVFCNGNTAPLKAASDFFSRADVADDNIFDNRPGISTIQMILAIDVPVSGFTNEDIAIALDKGGILPMHAKALADAVRDSGIVGLDDEQSAALFSTANPAGRELLEVLQNSPEGISAQELYSFAISVLRNHSQAIADGTAATKLLVPLDARVIAGRAYAKAPDDPAKVDRLVAAAFSACGADGSLRAIVRSNIEAILADGDGLATEEMIRGKISGFRDNLAELREISAFFRKKEEFFDVGSELLAGAGAPFPRGTLTKIFRAALKLPVDDLAHLKGHSEIADIHKALAQLNGNIARLSEALGDVDLTAIPNREKALEQLVAGCMLFNLGEADVAAIHTTIRSQNAAKAVFGYASIRDFAAGKRGANFSDEDLNGLETSGRRHAALLRELNRQICRVRELDAAQNTVPEIDGRNLRPADYDAEGLLAAMSPHAQNHHGA